MQDAPLRSAIYSFLLDRFEFYLQESRKVHPQVARAIRRARTAGDLQEVSGQLVAYGKIASFSEKLNVEVGTPQVLAVAGLLKRAANIQRQARERGVQFPHAETPELLADAAEQELARQVTEVDAQIQKSYGEEKYGEVITAIAGLQPVLNAFFDSVMVMVDDTQLRDNRLALLARTESTVRWAADLSELASL